MPTPHNPDNLTPEQIGKSYRLLDEDELYGPGLVYDTDLIEAWDNSRQLWLDGVRWTGQAPWLTYRTQLDKSSLASVRNPRLSPPTPPMTIDPTSRPRPNVYILRPRLALWALTGALAVELALLIYIAFK